jgi:hypothetical protein
MMQKGQKVHSMFVKGPEGHFIKREKSIICIKKERKICRKG